MTDLQHKMSSQLCRVSTIKTKTLTKKKQNPLSWSDNVQEDQNVVGQTASLHSDESSLPEKVISPTPVEAASPFQWYQPLYPNDMDLSTSSERVNLTLLEENAMAPPKAVALQGNADYLQDLSLPPFLVSRFLARLKFGWDPKGEAQ